MKILLIEDDKAMANGVEKMLLKAGYQTDVVREGLAGLDQFLSGIYDLALIDIMLPQVNGMEIVRQARAEGLDTPVILLTGKTDQFNVVEGLDCGADDYLTKPFDAEELLARIRAHLRSSRTPRRDSLSLGDIRLDPFAYRLVREDRSVKLSKKEYQLMEYFLVNQGRILSRDMLLSRVWGPDSDADYNNLEVYISFLRKKLKHLETSVTILTTKGVGYSIEVLDYDA